MKKIRINLLPKKERNIVDRLMYFLLHYFRYVVVLTQIVVISVFFARFKLDQDIIDNKESFMQKQEIMDAAEPLIADAKLIAEKERQIERIIDQQNKLSSTTTTLLSLVPNGVTLLSFGISDGEVMLEGETGSVDLISKFYNKLKKRDEFGLVDLVSVDGTAVDGFKFSMEIK